MRPLLAMLDPWLYRYAFEGASARRYAGNERCGFGDIDDRLADDWAADLADASVFLDVGAGPAILARTLRRRNPSMQVIALEPSAAFTRRSVPGITTIRGRAERIPLADGSVDIACCLSSIRHVQERRRSLSELRRVVRAHGVLYIVELDPDAPRARYREHTRRMKSLWSRLTFTPLVMRTAPSAQHIASLARDAGWQTVEHRDDPIQPVYVLRLS